MRLRRQRKTQIQFSNSPRSRLANAPPPRFFERRGVRLQSRSPGKPRGWSAEQRLLQSTPCGAGVRNAGRAPLSAPSRRFSCGGRSLRTGLGPRLPPGANRAPVVQLAPSTQVVMPVGRGPEASREWGYEPRPQAPHPIPLKRRLMTTPSVGSDDRRDR